MKIYVFAINGINFHGLEIAITCNFWKSRKKPTHPSLHTGLKKTCALLYGSIPLDLHAIVCLRRAKSHGRKHIQYTHTLPTCECESEYDLKSIAHFTFLHFRGNLNCRIYMCRRPAAVKIPVSNQSKLKRTKVSNRYISKFCSHIISPFCQCASTCIVHTEKPFHFHWAFNHLII